MAKKTQTPQKSQPEKEDKVSTQSKPSLNDNLEKYIKDFTNAVDYVRDNYHSDWFDCWKIYNNRRVKIGYNSIADAFVPETRTIVEALVANIAGSQPKFEYIPTDEEQEADTKVLTNLIDYYWDANHMGTKSQNWVRDSILYGTGVLHITWDADRNIPCIDNVPLRDFFVSPDATTLENARFAGFRYLADREEMKKMKVVDPETGDLVPKYYNLDMTQASTADSASPDLMDKPNKESLLGVKSSNNNERQIEVIIIYYMDEGNERIVEIANRTTVIRDVETPYQRDAMTQEVEVVDQNGIKKVKKDLKEIEPFMPFAILRNVIDSSLFYGTGDVQVILDRQETLNDVENLDLDNLHYMNNVMWRIDPAYEDMSSDIESTPGIVIPIPRFGLEPIEKPQITGDLDQKKQEIKEEMRRATAADEIIQGSAPFGSRTTATEVAQITNQAMTRFETKKANLESEGYAQLGSVLFKMSQLFVDQKTAIRIVGPEGVAFKDYDPYEFDGYYEPHVKLDSTVKKMKQEQGMKDNQLFQLLLNNPVVNQQEAIRMIATSLDASPEDINKLLTPPQGAQNPMIPMQPGQPQPQPGQGVNPQDEVAQAIAAAHQDFAAGNVPQGPQGPQPPQGTNPQAEVDKARQQAHVDFGMQQMMSRGSKGGKK